MFISGSSNGCNQCSDKRKAQVLKINSAGNFKRRRRLLQKGWSPVCPFLNMEVLVKNQVENGLSKLFDLRGQTIDVSDQAVFTLNDSGLHNEEGIKTNASNPLE